MDARHTRLHATLATSMKILRSAPSSLWGASVPRARPLHYVLLSVGLACSRGPLDEEKGSAKVRAPEASCAADAAQKLPELPSELHGFCLPPAADVRRFGLGRGAGLHAVCQELLGDHCESSKTSGLRSVSVAELRDPLNPYRELRATIFEFDDVRGAFGFVQSRSLGTDGDAPSEATSVEVSGARAYVHHNTLRIWRGRRALEVRYIAEDQSRGELLARARLLLPEVAQTAAASLDAEQQVPYEVRFFEEDPDVARLGPARLIPTALGLSQTGAGASADLLDRHGQYRALLFPRLDEPSAKDLMRTIQWGLNAPPTGKNTGILRARRLRSEAEPESWYFYRVGRLVLGVGPLPEGLRKDPSEPAKAVMEARLARLARRAYAFPPPQALRR